MTPDRLPMALTAFGLPHTMGYQPTLSGQAHGAPIGPVGLMDLAVELGLSGVEFPLPAPETLSTGALKDALEARGLRVILDYPGILRGELGDLRSFLETAVSLNVKVVRSTLSGVLCGDRRNLSGGWNALMEATITRLKEALPLAEDLGVSIALENHQDATSADLIQLYEMTGRSPSFGVTLDAGNPLAVGEGPVEFARRVGPLLRHLHLKDYTIHWAPEGYRLVRCAAGDGVVDFPAVLEIARRNGFEMLPGIEVGAQATRTIPLLEAGWWECYPTRPADDLVAALRILWRHGRPMDEPYSSAWERGDDSAAVSAEEMDIVRRSAAYFHRLAGERRAEEAH